LRMRRPVRPSLSISWSHVAKKLCFAKSYWNKLGLTLECNPDYPESDCRTNPATVR
jgi:hypothetical protein